MSTIIQVVCASHINSTKISSKRARDAAENSRAESTTTSITTMSVCMVTHIEGRVSVDQPGKVAIPARGQLNIVRA